MSNNIFGIDIGTSNLRIYNQADNSVFMEKNMIAIENKKTLLAYGDSAYDMYEKAPQSIVASFPVINGVIADINNMQTLIEYFISDLSKGGIKPADYFVAVPTDVTEVEKRAFYDLIRDASIKAHKIYIVEKAVADGLGLGVDVKHAQGVMVVNVGYSTTEVSILSLGGIVLSRLIKTAGFAFIEDIRNAVRKDFNLFIGEKSAERVLMSLNELVENKEEAVCYGRDIVSGLPVEKHIPTDVIDMSMRTSFGSIADCVKQILERTPPELGADIYRHGIYLTGGASQAHNLAEYIADSTGIKVNVGEDPINSVVDGLAKIINEEKYRPLAYTTIEGLGTK
ncbi:MAG: rod shape-determining protein [Lachnospiraceae bacterium]|nr:rod shape-determining protein [Lachnospiraceae bacterium]MDY5000332.1 rod shape-determining protein [Lachnospiraceae bacterium]